MKIRSTDMVQGFRNSIPYINAHRGKTFLFLIDGDMIEHKNFSNIIHDIILLHSLGIKVVVVYGVRKKIDSNLVEFHQIEPIYHKHTRVTDNITLNIIKKNAGLLQSNMTALLSMSINNTRLQRSHRKVVSGNFITAKPLGIDDGVDYGNSGCIRGIDDEFIKNQLIKKAIVLIGPLAISWTGESFNINSEEVATELAIKLQAEKIFQFSSSNYVKILSGRIFSEIFPNEAKNSRKKLQEAGDYYSSTVRFLYGAVKACRSGVRRIHIISYQEDSLLQELFSMNVIGTQIVMECAEKVRRATRNDICGILEIIRPLEQKGILVRRSREQLEREIDHFTIIELDNMTIACAALYPFYEENIGEMACLAVHPDYRNYSRGDILLQKIEIQARKIGLEKLFILTTSSFHWFKERGFIPADVDILPIKKKKLYNYQRCSKILFTFL